MSDKQLDNKMPRETEIQNAVDAGVAQINKNKIPRRGALGVIAKVTFATAVALSGGRPVRAAVDSLNKPIVTTGKENLATAITLEAVEVADLSTSGGAPEYKPYPVSKLDNDPNFAAYKEQIDNAVNAVEQFIQNKPEYNGVNKVRAVIQGIKQNDKDSNVTPVAPQNSGNVLITTKGYGFNVDENMIVHSYNNNEIVDASGVPIPKTTLDSLYVFPTNDESGDQTLVAANWKDGTKYAENVFGIWAPVSVLTVKDKKVAVQDVTSYNKDENGQIYGYDSEGKIMVGYFPGKEEFNNWFTLDISTQESGIPIEIWTSNALISTGNVLRQFKEIRALGSSAPQNISLLAPKINTCSGLEFAGPDSMNTLNTAFDILNSKTGDTITFDESSLSKGKNVWNKKDGKVQVFFKRDLSPDELKLMAGKAAWMKEGMIPYIYTENDGKNLIVPVLAYENDPWITEYNIWHAISFLLAKYDDKIHTTPSILGLVGFASHGTDPDIDKLFQGGMFKLWVSKTDITPTGPNDISLK